MPRKSFFFIVGATFLFFSFITSPLLAQEDIPYTFFEKKGMEALRDGYYADALFFFKEALLINPSAVDSLYFLNAINRMDHGYVDIVNTDDHLVTLQKEADHKIKKNQADQKQVALLALFEEETKIGNEDLLKSLALQKVKGKALDERKFLEEGDLSVLEDMVKDLDQSITQKALLNTELDSEIIVNKERAQTTSQDVIEEASLIPELAEERTQGSERLNVIDLDVFYLTTELWETATNLSFEIEMGKSIIMEGLNIERFLVITPEIINVESLDKNRLLITANQRGKTTFLVWESQGRWSFTIDCILPVSRGYRTPDEAQAFNNKPFRFDYRNYWSTYYSDRIKGSLSKETLSFNEWLGVYGETPYGYFDASLDLRKLGHSTDVSGYTIGLSNGLIGPFSNFNIRGFDARKTFSPLTLSAKHFRGILFEHQIFDKAIEYSFVHGRDIWNPGTFSSWANRKKDFFITGGQVILFPEENHWYAFNYVEGSGRDQPISLTDQVMSLRTAHDMGYMDFGLEVARSKEASAIRSDASFELNQDMKLIFDFRDIDKNFSMVTATPSSLGETGGITTLLWESQDFSLNTFLDVYKTNYLNNLSHPDVYNYDWNVFFRKPFEDRSSWTTNFYLSDTPGLASPLSTVRIFNNYSKNWEFLNQDRFWTFSLGQSYQRSRYDYSPTSEFDRFGLSSGIQLPLVEDLYYYLNYEHFFLKETLTGERSQPNVLTTGLNYTKNLTKHISGVVNISYRDEQEAGSILSFLAGEDSAGATLSLSYRPHSDFDLYMAATTRKVWPEDNSRDSYLDVDVRLGARFSWETPFSWNPQGMVSGCVFKDVNADGVQGFDEPGIPGVIIVANKETTVTDENGNYIIKVVGKQAQVSVDFDSVPGGYIFSTSPYQQVKVVPHKTVCVHFGLTTRSGIYGVVYSDRNNNGKPDKDDEFIPNVRIVVDGQEDVVTSNDGSYSFSNIPPGPHSVKLDINSLPIEYLPLIKLDNEIEVQEGTTYIFHIPLKKK